MIDTLTMELREKHAPEIDFLGETTQFIEYGGDSTTRQGQTYVNGNLGNLRVSISAQRVKITGSLAKWYLGSNFQTLTRSDIIKAIDKLCATLHLPLWEADITRVDIGTNFIVKHATELYFGHLGELSRHTRQPISDNGIKGVNYQNGNRVLKFYDKIREQKHRHEPIPSLYQGQNVVRVELSVAKRLREQFNVKRLTPRELTDEMFYIDLIKQWQTNYHNITKIKTMGKIDLAALPTKEMARAALKIVIEEQGGEALFCEKVKEAYRQGLITKKQKEDKIQKVREAARGDFGITSTPEITDELDQKINEVARFGR